ncbi:MAG: ribonuclease P [Candidatus Aenigmarchaeota archaeon]|nr:ribonuclease P [Candidatus Aenigmarchaeota archaeon]
MKGAKSGVRSRKKPGWQQDIARERIEILFANAEKEFSRHPARSHRYAELARKIGMRYNVSIPKKIKGRVCKKCNRYLFPGINAKVRTSSARQAMEVRCLECGHVARHPYSKEKRK